MEIQTRSKSKGVQKSNRDISDQVGLSSLIESRPKLKPGEVKSGGVKSSVGHYIIGYPILSCFYPILCILYYILLISSLYYIQFSPSYI